MTDNNATRDEVMRALGLVVWRYGELVFVLAQTVWLLMAETPSGRTFGPFATSDLDFVKMVRAIQRLANARDLSPDLKKRIEGGAKRALGWNCFMPGSGWSWAMKSAWNPESYGCSHRSPL